jgi:pimeloyl-ACP methyl ester carboxylesterase
MNLDKDQLFLLIYEYEFKFNLLSIRKEQQMATLVSTDLQEVSLPQGVVRYSDQGTGPTLVFIHGIFVNSLIWRQVIPLLSEHFRCIAPDLPLGAHTVPLRPEADLSPLGVAHLVADFLTALNLQDVTLVGNDTGGAICQLVIAHYPERITRLVLTNCDAFEAFFPLLVSPFHYGAQFFGTRFADFLAWLFHARFAQRLLVATVSLRHPDLVILDSYFTPFHNDKGIRRDLTKFLRAVSNRYTKEAARTFPGFQFPVLLVWGKRDIFFSSDLARRLQQAFPDATLEFVSQSRAFVPEDQPEFLAQRIMEFVNESVKP